MFITDKNELKNFTAENRIWQGIPGIEVTKKGRVFVTFYSGGVKEEIGNFVVLLKSDDGVNFSQPMAVAYKEGFRCYDPCLWIDTLGRLWLFWGCAPKHGVYAVVCDDPDGDELVWSDVKYIANDVMMNKPTVLSGGEWLLPIAVWKKGIKVVSDSEDTDRRAFVYKSIDNGESFEKIGGIDMPQRSFDEHMVLEHNDGTLAMYVRTFYGIGVSYSYDSGKTWTKGEDSGLGGPCSRFFIKRLKSGRVLLVNHYEYTGRNNLTALLSEDEGKTWKYKLLLDERAVSYPDGVQTDDGYIYITYDRDRGCFRNSLKEAYNSAREVLYCRITEEDIMAGKLVSDGSFLKRVASKLDKYAKENENPYNEPERLSENELANCICDKNGDEITAFLFDRYNVNCNSMHTLESSNLDELIEKLNEEKCDRKEIVCQIIRLIRSVTACDENDLPVIDRIKSIIDENLTKEMTLYDISNEIGISMYYMCHIFKKSTGITIVDYKNTMKLRRAKQLLVSSDKKITDIALECGFSDSSYFTKVFSSSENVTPAEYRKMLKRG